MAGPKILEIIVRARDEAQQSFERSGRAAGRYGDQLAQLNQRHAALQKTQRDLAAQLQDLDKRRTALRRSQGVGVFQQQAQQLRDEIAQQRARAYDPATPNGSRIVAIQKLKDAKQQLLSIEKQIDQEMKQQNANRRRLVELDKQRAQILERQRRGDAAGGRLEGASRQRAQRVLDQADLQLLARRAQLGDAEARQQLQLTELRRRHRTEAQALLRIANNQLLTTRQRVVADQKLVDLYRLQAKELAQVRGAGRQGLISTIGRGAVGGAAAAGVGPRAGSGAYAAAGGVGGPAGIAAGAGGYLASRGLAAATQASREFEHAMSRVRALTQATEEDMARLGAQAQDLGRTTVYNAREAAEAQQAFALAGFNVNQILAATPPALRLAAAGQIELGEAALITSRIMAGMQIGAEGVSAAVDQLANAFTTANTDLSELGTAMSFVGPIANAANKDLAETTAVLQALANAGFNGEKGGTAFRQILIKLTNTTGDAEQQLERLGIQIQDDAGNLLNMADIVANFDEALGHLGSAQRLEVLSQIFEARAAAGFMALMGQGADAIRDFEDAANKTGGTANRIAEVQFDNLEGAMVRLKSAGQGLGITLGDTLNPSLRTGAEAATELINKLNDLAKATGPVNAKARDEIGALQEKVFGSLEDQDKGLSLNFGRYYTQLARLTGDVYEYVEARQKLAQVEDRVAAAQRRADNAAPEAGVSPEVTALTNRMAVLNAQAAQRAEQARQIAAGFANPEQLQPILDAAKPDLSPLQEMRQQLQLINQEYRRQATIVPASLPESLWGDEARKARKAMNDLAAARATVESRIADQLERQAAAAAELADRTARLELDRRAKAGDADAAAELASRNAAAPFRQQARDLRSAAADPDTGFFDGLQSRLMARAAEQAGASAGRAAAEAAREAADQATRDNTQRISDGIAQAQLQALRDRAAATGLPGDEMAVQRRQIELEFEQRRRDLEQQLERKDLSAGQRFDINQLLEQLPKLLQGRLGALGAFEPSTGRGRGREPLDGRLQTSELDRQLGSRGQSDAQQQTANNTAEMVRAARDQTEALKLLADYLRDRRDGAEAGGGESGGSITLTL